MSQARSISFAGELDTKTDAKALPLGKFSTVQNVVYNSPGALAKRYGQALLPQVITGTTNFITSATSFSRFKDELLLFDGASLFGYGAVSSSWTEKTSLTEVDISSVPIVQNTLGTRSAMSSCVADGLEVYAWEDSRGGVRYSVRDQSSGLFYVADAVVDLNGALPQVARSGNYINIFYCVANGIYACQVQITNPQSLSGSFFLSNTAINNGLRAICVAPTTSTASGRLYVAYVSGVDLVVNAFGGNLVFQFGSTAIAGFNDGGAGLQVDPTGNYLAIAAVSASTHTVQIWDVDMVSHGTTTVTGGLTPGRATPTWTSGSAALTAFFDSQAAGAPAQVTARTVTRSGVTPTFTGANSVSGVQLASGAFTQGGVGLAVTVSPSTQKLVPAALSIQTSYYVINDSGKFLLRFYGGNAGSVYSVISQPANLDANTWQVILQYRQQLRADATGTVFTTTAGYAAKLTFPVTSHLTITEMNTTAIISCGNVYTYDGAQIIESGYWEFPEGPTVSVGPAASGSLNSAGLPGASYEYCFVYEWADNAGNMHYSPPSFPLEAASMPANGSTVLQIPTLSLTLRTGVVIGVYRPVVNSSGPFYRIGQITNDPTVINVTYSDTASDASILGNQYLYAEPDGSGELENDPPPPFLATIATKTRVFGLSAENPYQVWYSKPIMPGRPTEWNEAQVQTVEAAGGAGTALGAMDTLLVLFKESRAYYLPGDGPNAGGYPADSFGQFQLISSASGCTNQGSVVATDKGLFYRSQRGLEMLERSLATNYEVGFPVYAFKDLNIAAATVVPDQNQVRFATSDTGLWYDYTVNRWSTVTNHEAVGATFWNEVYVRCDSQGRVWQETPGSYLDNGSAIPMIFETGWIPMWGSRQGYGRVRWLSLLGNYVSSHLMNIQYGFDYQDYSFLTTWNPQTGLFLTTYGSESPYGAEEVYGGYPAAAYQLRARMPQQKCQSIRLKFYDSNANGASCTLDEFALELSEKSGLARLPAGQTV